MAGGFVREGELELLKDAIAAHIDDPDTLVVSPLFIQAWGRRPDERALVSAHVENV